MSSRERLLIQRIGRSFAFVVCGLPFVLLGGAWQLVLIPMIVAAAVALISAVRLRRLQPDEQPSTSDDAGE